MNRDFIYNAFIFFHAVVTSRISAEAQFSSGCPNVQSEGPEGQSENDQKLKDQRQVWWWWKQGSGKGCFSLEKMRPQAFKCRRDEKCK